MLNDRQIYSVVVTYRGTQVSTMIILEFMVIFALEWCNKTLRTVDAAQTLSHLQTVPVEFSIKNMTCRTDMATG